MRRSPVRFREAAPTAETLLIMEGTSLLSRRQARKESDLLISGALPHVAWPGCLPLRRCHVVACGTVTGLPATHDRAPGDSPARHFHGSSLYGEVLRSSTDTYPKYVPNTLYTELRFWRSVVQLGRVARWLAGLAW